MRERKRQLKKQDCVSVLAKKKGKRDTESRRQGEGEMRAVEDVELKF